MPFWGFDKQPWSPRGQAEWREQSPIAHVHKASTLTLILCNTGDLRVPITESYKLYHSLDDTGVPVKFVAVLFAETFCPFMREFSPLSPIIAQNSSSNLLGIRLVSFAGVAEEATAVMIDV